MTKKNGHGRLTKKKGIMAFQVYILCVCIYTVVLMLRSTVLIECLYVVWMLDFFGMWQVLL